MAATARRLDQQLVDRMIGLQDDPLGFVRYAYPWGEKGGPLERYTGPDEWQTEELAWLGEAIRERRADPLAPALQAVYSSGHGIGKALPDSSPVMTPTGPRPMGDLQVGDTVLAWDGAPTRVTGVYPQGLRPIYRMVFDDGSTVLCDLDHLWRVRGRRERRTHGDWLTLSTRDLLARGLKRHNGAAQARQWEIPRQGPAQFQPREVPIAPYLLGVWLGDGSAGQGRYCKPAPEVAERIRALGYTVSDEADGKGHGVYGIRAALRDLGLLDLGSPERYVPDAYRINSAEVRAEVLRGLLDTDGECTRAGSLVYSTTSPRLADDVLWLVRSLGGKATRQPTPKQSRYRNDSGALIDCRDCYRVTLRLPDGFRPFYVARKAERVPETVEARYLTRWIDRIEYSHDEPATCIRVSDPLSLYLADHFVVTHNTAFAAWIIHWFASTRPRPAGVVTANTDSQLSTKTWRELAKWHAMSIHRHWFTWTATRFSLADSPETHFIAAIPWSEHRSEAFAGLHERHVLVLYDEASAIADTIWDVSSGAMSTGFADWGSALWVALGNPTRATGRFYDAAFGKLRHRWHTRVIDARKARMANQAQIQQWIEDYGEDSDFVRVRVRGLPPRAGNTQFIPSDLVEAAQRREVIPTGYESRLISVDVARFGGAETVICRRQGRKVYPLECFRGLDTMQVAAQVGARVQAYEPDVCFVDGVGIGAGVVDRLRQLGFHVIDVQSGTAATDREKYYNLRAEMWARLRDWLAGADLPDDPILAEQLTGLEYGFDARSRLQLERKEDMQKRGLSSPDRADALALSFAYEHPPTRLDSQNAVEPEPEPDL